MWNAHFDLTQDTPKQEKVLYAWSYGEPEEIIAILELPQVRTALDAVKVGDLPIN